MPYITDIPPMTVEEAPMTSCAQPRRRWVAPGKGILTAHMPRLTEQPVLVVPHT